MSQKRSVSPSAEAHQDKRSCISLTSHNVTISSSANDTLGKIKSADDTLAKIKTKTKIIPAPRTNQFVAINARLPKCAARNRFNRFGAAEEEVTDNRMRSNNTEKQLIKSAPVTNKSVAINSRLPVPPARDRFSIFGAAETKATALWMRSNKVVGARGKHVAAFQDLLYSLGCQNPSFDKETLLKFHRRLERNLTRIKKVLKECGAISFHTDDNLETKPNFADWTVVWLEENWHGVYDTRKYYTDHYLEKYSPALEGQDRPEVVVVELPVDEPFEEEVEILVVEDPTEFRITNATETGAGTIREPEYDSNPYRMADWK
ncbi:hypothetical protein SBOR_9942 [Sclerotinia borealis F-4128]|uniref:Uncharacterized protein n=1 Tax=Sclerotinia borealis (strain F-4128) TaxID=1432307 RepID=W9C419_SCLBF|nr:hypothetical protein SBOR_9942 [Sclerotinia borealis F-4128]